MHISSYKYSTVAIKTLYQLQYFNNDYLWCSTWLAVDLQFLNAIQFLYKGIGEKHDVHCDETDANDSTQSEPCDGKNK